MLPEPSNGPWLSVVGFGGNLDQPAERLLKARTLLAQSSGIRELAFSSLYRSRPLGPEGQPDYVNAVMAVDCDLSPLDLLDLLQKIEQEEGRVRTGERWGPRTLDLDLLLYGESIIDHPRLKVPHPRLAEREFVLYPLSEILPDLMIPGLDVVKTLKVRCPANGIQRLSS